MTNSDDIELLTSEIDVVETSDLSTQPATRAIIRMKLITEGPNKKNLEWNAETMKKIAHMFRGVPFRYDLTGQNEGSHTKERLSSPYYDVGWTYSGEKGAYYDPMTNAVWVEGEITHPEVISKLQRMTTDGKREINFGSMGAMMKPEHTKCGICNKSPFGTCEHQRGETYNQKICNMVPTDISKALHVALTNDPADTNATIASAIFQDMTNSIDSSVQQSPVPVSSAGNIAGTPDLRTMIREVILELDKEKQERESRNSSKVQVQEENNMEKKKKKVSDDKVKEEKREDVEKEVEKGNPDTLATSDTGKCDGINNPELKKTPDEDGTIEEADSGKDEEEEEEEEKEVPKKKKKKENKDEDEEEDEKEAMQDGSEFKIKGPAAKGSPQTIETQDNAPVFMEKPKAIVETASIDYSGKYKQKLVMELADSYVKYNKAKSKDEAVSMLSGKSIEQLEIYQDAYDGVIIPTVAAPVAKKPEIKILQDNNHLASKKFANEVPEFGGAIEQDGQMELQDMSPEERRKTLGEYGAYDVCFNPGNAHKYRKNK